MKFYRQATGEDFQETEMAFKESIPLFVRVHEHENNRRQAIHHFREHGVSVQDAVRQLNEYAAFRRASADFLAGKSVYIEY